MPEQMKNFNEFQLRKIALEMIRAGVSRGDPASVIQKNISLVNGLLRIKEDEYDLTAFDKILLFGIGKAAPSMCRAFEEILVPDDGLVITKKGEEIAEIQVKSIPVYQGFHPELRQENLIYTNELLEKINGISPQDKTLVIFMISGGGSVLFEALPNGISLEDLFLLNELLIRSGATIHHINAVRKQVSLVKGGRFGKLVADKGGTLVSLILSDVIGDDLSVIASGPTYKDKTTFDDAINILHQYGIWEATPERIKHYLEEGKNCRDLETAKILPAQIRNYLVGTNRSSLEAARDVAKGYGFNTMILTGENKGEAREVAKAIMAIARKIKKFHQPLFPPAALILGGEMTVKFNQDEPMGLGGPNREFVLSSAMEIRGCNNIVVAAVDTDGKDGQGKSGAIADGHSLKRSELDPTTSLREHNTEKFFDSLSDSIEFTSNTNVNDLIVVLVGG